MKNKMNVGLITYVNSGNYGAALQLFATYKAIEKCGHNPIVINYQNKYEASQKSFKFIFEKYPFFSKIKIFISRYIFKTAKNGKRCFDKFYNEKFIKTNRLNSISEISKLDNIDVYCVGSDQVWNPNITNGYDDVFTLNSKDILHKISYSSSMGSLNNNYDYYELKDRLIDFAYLSVREETTKVYLEKILNKKIQLTVDPTLLFDKYAWENMLLCKNDKNIIEDDYVLIYALSDFMNLNKIARKIANEINAKVACISLSSRPKSVDYLINNATPEMFISLIKNAKYVVTNSFHGTCFSIINEVPFFSVRFSQNPTRVADLVKKYKLENRFIDGDISLCQIKDNLLVNDIIEANNKIKDDAISSLNWLKEAIENA